MSAARGWYSVIQYCPDPSRSEAANVGILLFCPERGFVRARTSRGSDRVRRFFQVDPSEITRIKSAKRSFERRVEVEAPTLLSIEDLKQFIGTRAHSLILTEPRVLRVEKPEQDLDQLFEEIVGGRARRQPRTVAPDLPELHATFDDLRSSGRNVSFDVKVNVPLVGEHFRAPYAYQNSTLHIVRTFGLRDGEKNTARYALHLAGMGRLVNLHSTEFTQPATLIVASSLNEQSELESRLVQVFKDHDVKFYPRDSLRELIERVQREVT